MNLLLLKLWTVGVNTAPGESPGNGITELNGSACSTQRALFSFGFLFELIQARSNQYHLFIVKRSKTQQKIKSQRNILIERYSAPLSYSEKIPKGIFPWVSQCMEFATDVMLSYLLICVRLYLDGTFFLVGTPFHQLFTTNVFF